MTRDVRWTSRSGMVLLAVLVVIVLAAMIGTTLLVTVDAERSSAETNLRRTQSRANAWSGVQYVMAQLAEHREEMLQGQAVEIEYEWTLYEEPGGRRAVVRLAPIGGGTTYMVSEPAKLDLNLASKEMLAKLPGIGTAERAQKIIDARPFTSVEELVRVEGVAADVLYGFVDDPMFDTRSDATGNDETRAEEPAGTGESAAGSSSLIDLLTVFSFDPNVQAGIESPDKRGKLRVNLNVPWSDRFERAIEEQWGSEAVAIVKQLFDQGMQFRTDREMIQNVRQMGINDPEILAGIVDAVTTSDDMYRLGRVDVLLASPEVLACLAGIDYGRALDIVDRRDRLSEEARLSAMWLVDEGILSLDEYQAIADLVTTRSLQWRVRVEAGFEESSSYERVAGVAESVLEGLAEMTSETTPLQDRVVYDVVIDVASERARVAYLRDVTMLDLARDLRKADVQDRISEDQRAFEAELWDSMGIDEAVGDGESADAEEVRVESDEPSWRSGSRIDAARDDRRQRREARTEASANRRADASPRSQPEPARTMPGEPVDRRIGRWRSGGGT